MLKRIIILLVAWMGIFVLHATNHVSIESVSGAVGSTADIIVSLKNDSPDIAAAEIRIPFPDGVVPINGSLIKNESRLPNHNITADMKNGSYVMVVYNTSLSSISKGDGELCRFKIELGDNPGNFDINPAVKLSDKAGSVVSSSVSGGTLTILGAKLEIDSQQLVDFRRVPIRSTQTREIPIRNIGTTPLEISGFDSAVDGLSASFSPNKLEAGQQGIMTLEYTPTVRSKEVQGRIYVNSNSAGSAPYLVITSQPFSVNELHIGNAEGISDEEVTVSVKVNNMEPIVGAEFTLKLPDALEYVEGSAKKSSRAYDMSIEAYYDASRSLRIILYNASNKSLAGDDGEILTFKLKLRGNAGTYYLNPKKVILTNRDGENMTSASYTGSISISSPRLSSSSKFNIGNVPLNESNVFDYAFYNYGNATLRIDKVAFLDEGFSCKNQFPVEIGHGEQGALQVVIDKPAFGPFTTTMNLYTNDPSNRMKSVEVSGNFYSTNELSFSGHVFEGKYMLRGSLDNEAEIVAVQMDILLPSGVTCSESNLTLSPRASSHSAILAYIGSGRYRIILFSLNNTPFYGNEGELFTLALNGAEVEGKELRIENVKLSTANGIDYTSPDSHVLIETVPIFVKSITLSETEVSIKVNQTIQLSATVLPDNTTDKTVAWTSSDESVAIVDANGKITAKAPGETTITATCGSVKSTCKVTVIPTSVESVRLSNTSLSLTEGETATLTATVSPSDATDKTVTWTSSDTSVATVSADGKVTAVKTGTATVTASSFNGKTATCIVMVSADIIPVTGISISKSTLNITEGEMMTLAATLTPSDATDKSVTWTSSDMSVATVSADGTVTAVKAGTATITASSSNGKTATCTVTVAAKIIEAAGITLDRTSAELKVGETITLTATVLPENTTDKTVIWTSSDESVAIVDANGKITAKAPGETT
ncbi:MAG: Ig-like domain-containing protein, partial [Muribaculaceae bacterium]|nr:Ig-like domain-containing protein [Muribaculaceae bacterium]